MGGEDVDTGELERVEHMDWEGELKVAEGVEVGEWAAANVEVKVRALWFFEKIDMPDTAFRTMCGYSSRHLVAASRR